MLLLLLLLLLLLNLELAAVLPANSPGRLQHCSLLRLIVVAVDQTFRQR
jgi:hypothetical protein